MTNNRGTIGFVLGMALAILIGLILLAVCCFFRKKVQGAIFTLPAPSKVFMLFGGTLLLTIFVITLYAWHHSHDTESCYVVDFDPSVLQNLDPEYLVPRIQSKIGCSESELRVSESDYFSVTFENSAQQGVNACVYQMHFSFFVVEQVEDGSLKLLTYQATKTNENNIQIVYCGQSQYEPTTIEHSKPLSTLLNAVKDFPIQLYQSSTSVGGENCDYYKIQWAANKTLDAEIFSYGGAKITNDENQYINFFIAQCKKEDSGLGGPIRAELHYIP